jgi:murein L,D-transpeptidase YcbB/YkuD
MQQRIISATIHGAMALVLMVMASLSAHAANNEAVGAALKKLIQEPSVKTGSAFADANFADIKAFYGTRSFKPVWSRDSGPKGKAKALLGELKASTVHGLSPESYGVEELSKLMKSRDPAELARMDFLFSGALIEFSHDLLNGRATNQGREALTWVKPIRLDPAKLIERAAFAGNLRVLLNEIIGDDRRYLRLVAKMIEFVRLEQSGMWPNKLAKDDFPALRRLLALTGDLPFDQMNSEAGMDEALSKAVAAYQARHGMESDGKLGPKTLAKLNEPIGDRVRSIKANLERRRWQNQPKDPKQLYLNLVDGQLKLAIKDKTRALVGVTVDESLTKLPTFYGKVQSVRHAGSGEQASIELLYDGGELAKDLVKPGAIKIGNANGAAYELLDKALDANDQSALETFKADKGEMKLSAPLDLFVTYLTVWATRDGKIQFRPDVLQRDAALIEAMGL